MGSGTVNILLELGGGAVGVLGAVVLLLALFRDRSRGRRRCPKCWYDMTGVPGLTCPECGKTPMRERKLLKTRRHWRLATLALLATTLGIATAFTPLYRERGWRGLVPTTVLLLFAPPDGPVVWVDPKNGKQHENLFAKELWRRFDRPNVPSWQWRMALDAGPLLSTRGTWSVTEPFAVRVNLPEWLNVGSVELEPEGLEHARQIVVSNVSARRTWQTVGYLKPGTERVRVRVTLRSAGWGLNSAMMAGASGATFPAPLISQPSQTKSGELLYQGAYTLHVRAVPTLEDSMTPVSGAAIDAAVRRALTARVTWPEFGSTYRAALLTLTVDRDALGGHPQIALPVVVEVARDAEVLVSERASLGMCEMMLTPGKDTCEIRLGSAIRRELENPGPKNGWTIRVRGDLGQMGSEWQRETYWKGEITIPLEEAIVK
jgi:hypothetical protein